MTFAQEEPPVGRWPEDDGVSPPTGTGVAIERLWPDPIDLEALSEREPEPPKFIIPDWLPVGYATLFSGHGGVGKSGIALHLSVCMALGIPFFGLPVRRCRVMYMSCEDRESVLHWRLYRICKHLDVDMAALRGWLDIIDLVGKETVLWQLQPQSDYTYTPAFAELAHRFKSTERQVLFVDGISDTFGGGESARNDVKRFVNQLISLIDPYSGAVVLIGHVNRATAGSTETTSEGYSGTTGWHNSVRARWYLYPESKRSDEATEKTGSLLLDLQKSNLGIPDQTIRFAWDDGAHLFLGETVAAESIFERRHRERQERSGILQCLRDCISKGISVPAASTGQRTAYHVLSAHAEFPESLKGPTGRTRFKRMVEEMRHAGDIKVQAVRLNYKDKEILWA